MLSIEQIYERHPELLELREFKTNAEIVEAFSGGGTMWEVWSSIGGDGGVSSNPKEVTGVGTYEGGCEALRGEPLYYHHYNLNDLNGEIISRYGFVRSLQNVPAKGVFTTRGRAEAFFEAVKRAFGNDPEWQAYERAQKAEEDELDSISDE